MAAAQYTRSFLCSSTPSNWVIAFCCIVICFAPALLFSKRSGRSTALHIARRPNPFSNPLSHLHPKLAWFRQIQFGPRHTPTS
jgi:hypothetical protein